MRYEKGLTLNLGQYQALRIAVTDCLSFEEADQALIQELKLIDIPLSGTIRKTLKLKELHDDNQ